MILSFKTKWDDGSPTYFIDKIWCGLMMSKLNDDESLNELYEQYAHYSYLYEKKFAQLGERHWDYLLPLDAMYGVPKIHTIRYDEHDRWQEGRDIHMYVHNRTPRAFQFAPVIPCTSVQYIKMIKRDDGLKINIAGHRLREDEKLRLAHNDGFNSIKQFDAFFISEMERDVMYFKLIHWTDFRY